MTQNQKNPNIIVILCDDLGYGSLGCFGAKKLKTPHLDRLAAEGMRLTHAHGPSAVCTPSRYSLLTGSYAWRNVPPENRAAQWEQWRRMEIMKDSDRWIGHVAVEPNEPLLIQQDQMTVPHLLKQAGYATACVGKWHLGWGRPDQPGWVENIGPDWNRELPHGPLETGFDYFFGFPIVNCSQPKVFVENDRVVGLDPDDPIRLITAYNPHGRLQFRMEGGSRARIPQDQFDAMSLPKALDWIEQSSRDESPFFLFFGLSNPHWPFEPPPEYKGRSALGPRGDVIEEIDGTVGAIMAKLEEMGLAEDTLIYFSSDHGAEISATTYFERTEFEGELLNGPLRGQKTDIHEGANRVPTIARWPGRIRAGSECGELVASTDWLATCADLLGMELPEDAGPDSFSMLPHLLSSPDKQTARDTLITDSMMGVLALYEGPWKYIPEQGHGGFYSVDPGPPPGPDEPPGQLYHLEDDIGETRNLYTDHPEIVARMDKKLQELVKSGRSRQ